MIPESVIEQVLDRNSIVDVVSEYGITLKRAGANLKALCPFKTEDTPSFMVSPAKNICHCFGCGEGGNPIKFVMKYDQVDFYTAIQKLAKRVNITIEEREETESEKAMRLEREAQLAMMERVAAYYRALFKESEEAKEYAFGRWGEEFCEEAGIGFAPNSWDTLVSWAKSNGESLDRMKELSLVCAGSHGFYDFYKGRIMIPVKDRMGRVISFTARDITGNSEAPKYLNGKETPLFNKGEVLFNFHLARRPAAQQQQVYAVEGAPDCMRLLQIEVANVVAPLGTAWTEAHFKMLKPIAHRICFLPDADPPKDGHDYGAGVEAVIKNGKEAMKHGFSVSVKPIPLGKGGKKQDPDEYCTTIERFNELEERDFILWLATLRFDKAKTTEQKATVVTEIASLLALVENPTEQNMLIDELAEINGKKDTFWQKALSEQKRIANEQAASDKKEKKKSDEETDMEQLAKYGFYIKKGKYCSTTKDGSEWEWSNFIMQPLFHIDNKDSPKRMFYIVNEYGEKRLVAFQQDDLTSLGKFMTIIEGTANFIWMATAKEFTKLRRALYENMETATEIKQLGWQREGFYAFGNGVWDGTQFHQVDDMGIVRLGKEFGRNWMGEQTTGCYYLPAFSLQYKHDVRLFKFEKTFVHMGYSKLPLVDFTGQIFRVFGDNGRIGFCFLMATLFRDIVTAETRSFPILNLFGPKGSGKSELGHTLMSFFIIGNVPPNIQNSTLPALNDTVAAVSNALVHIDEFKNDIDIYKREFLKGLWDGTGRTRMNMDLDKKKETTSVDAGIILSGQEMATADIALFSRFVYLTFDTSEFTKEQQTEYNRLKEMRSHGVSHLTLQLLRHRKKMETEFKDIYRLTQSEIDAALENDRIEDRIKNNWLIPLAVLRTLEGSLGISLHYDEMKPVVIEGIRRQNAECKSNNELAGFWNTVQYLVSEGELIAEGDFRVDYCNTLKTDIYVNGTQWPQGRRVLMLQTTRVLKLYKKANKQTDEQGLPESSLKYYLEKSREYIGKKSAVRFKIFLKGGVPKMIPAASSTEHPHQASQTQRAMCFDYDRLVANYGINLESTGIDAIQPEDE